jgi:hypothetical protein
VGFGLGPEVGDATAGFFIFCKRGGQGEKSRGGWEFGGKAGLFADFVGGDAVQEFMAFYRNGLEVAGINGVIATFPEQVKAIFFQVAD